MYINFNIKEVRYYMIIFLVLALLLTFTTTFIIHYINLLSFSSGLNFGIILFFIIVLTLKDSKYEENK